MFELRPLPRPLYFVVCRNTQSPPFVSRFVPALAYMFKCSLCLQNADGDSAPPCREIFLPRISSANSFWGDRFFVVASLKFFYFLLNQLGVQWVVAKAYPSLFTARDLIVFVVGDFSAPAFASCGRYICARFPFGETLPANGFPITQTVVRRREP